MFEVDLYEKFKAVLDKKGVEFVYNEAVENILGMSGAMLSGSKMIYSNRFPDHEVFFNACIFNSDRHQIWYGDLDLTLSTDKLQEVANAIGTIYVTRETPYRWNGLGDSELVEFENLKIFNPKA